MLRDLLPLGSSKYFLAIGSHYACFFEIGRKGKLSILEETDFTGGENGAFEIFLARLRKNGSYFGQEIGVLVLEPDTYTMMRSADHYTLEDLRGECQKLQLDHTHQYFTRVNLFDTAYYVISGINEEFINLSLDQLGKAGFLISQVSSLAGLVIHMISQLETGKDPEVIIIGVGRYVCCLSRRNNGQVFYFEIIRSGGEKQKAITSVEEIIGASDSNSVKPRTMLFHPEREIATSLGHEWNKPERLFNHVPRTEKKNPFAIKNHISKETRRIMVSAGSARLLMSVMVMIAVLFGIVSSGFWILRRTSEDTYAGYQNRLAEVVSRETELSAVESHLRRLNSDYVDRNEFSGFLSLFFQKIPWNVYLTRLGCERTSTGLVSVTGRGEAQRETSIFSYRDYIRAVQPDVNVEIESISRMARNRTQGDSIWYEFELSLQ